jgi:hypothetical protein
MYDKNKNCSDAAIVHYIFMSGQVPVADLVKPHGNSKKNDIYSRTFTSTKQRMASTNVGTNELRSEIIEESGGIDKIDNLSSLPRSAQQINYERIKNK